MLTPSSFNSILIFSSYLRPKDPFPLGLHVLILRALLPSFILATLHVFLNILDLITLTILGTNFK